MWKYIPYQGQAFTYRFSTRMNRRMDDDLVHTKLNHHPTKMDILPKTFIQIILTATCRYMASAAFKYVPQSAVTTFAFFSVCCFFYGCIPYASIGDFYFVSK